jgi:predicted enzyme related to lactoylglutathione lyase
VKINLQVVVFDAADLNAESTFWARLLGGTVDAEDDWHMVLVKGEPKVGVQLAPHHVPPEWPEGTPQQIHLDLWVDDFEEAHTEVMSAGAKLLQAAVSTESPDNFQVYADPAGHPFCLCWVQDALRR